MSQITPNSNWQRAAFAEKVALQPVALLKPLGRETRRHGAGQVEKLCMSLKQFGWTAPVLIDEDNRIVAGNGRVAAAKKLGFQEVPCLVITHLSEAEKRAYAIADNQLGTLSDWDDEALAAEFAELRLLDDPLLMRAEKGQAQHAPSITALDTLAFGEVVQRFLTA